MVGIWSNGTGRLLWTGKSGGLALGATIAGDHKSVWAPVCMTRYVWQQLAAQEMII